MVSRSRRFPRISDFPPTIQRCSTLLALVFCILSGFCFASGPELQMVREINLRQIAPHGSYGTGFMLVGTPAQELFATRLAPDQSLLILNPDTSGEWSLVRLRNWWTAAPSTDVLRVPGWNKADARYMGETYVDLQVSPEGHYAVAFAGASWMQKGDAPFFVPLPKTARKADTIITVVDLERWRIVSSIHTANLVNSDFGGARILTGKWIALQGFDNRSPSQDSVYRRHNSLISIPDLKLGPECVSRRPGLDERNPVSPAAETMRLRNDADCRDILRETATASVKELESLIYMRHAIEPKSLRLRSLDFIEVPGLRTEGDRLAVAEENEILDYFDRWNLSRDQIVSENPPLESPSHAWYGLYDSHERYYYELDKFDSEGRKQEGRTARSLLCRDPNMHGRRSACGCRVNDISEEQHALLIYCRAQRGDFDGSWQRQWLSVFRSDNLSGVGFVRLSKDKETTEALAVRDGRTYIVVVELGQSVRIYAVPNP